MTVCWRESRLEDLDAVRLQIAQLDQAIELPEDTPGTRKILAWNARTWEDESGKILAILGIWPVWPGVGTAWALISGEALKHPTVLCRSAKRFLAMAIDRDGLWRVQTTIEHGHVASRRLNLWLGFRFEGVMERYGPNGLDHDLYAIVRRP